MKIYIAPQSEEGFTTLQATVATWRELLTLRPVPRGGSVSHQAGRGEATAVGRGASAGGATSPAARTADKGRVYFRKNVSEKMELCVRFPTGAVQVIATEP